MSKKFHAERKTNEYLECRGEPTPDEQAQALALAVHDWRIKRGLAKLRRSKTNPKVSLTASEREELTKAGFLGEPD